VKFHGWVKRSRKENVNQVNLDCNTKEKSCQPAGLNYKEFSHVNGPKDQAGGCLADLLFCATNIQIYTLQQYLFGFSSTDVYQINSNLKSICIEFPRTKKQEPNKLQIAK